MSSPKPKPPSSAEHRSDGSQPWLHQKGRTIQEFGTVKQFPVALTMDTRLYSCQRLNKVWRTPGSCTICTRSTTG